MKGGVRDLLLSVRDLLLSVRDLLLSVRDLLLSNGQKIKKKALDKAETGI
jgi:hypothetical protein